MPQKKQPAGQGWPIENVERRATDDLVPYARNARTHSDQQVDQIAASIAEWGWTMPVLIDEGGVILAGHGRVLAARRLGIDEVPVIVAKGWTDPQRRAYVLADNKLTLNGGWDDELLRVELSDLEFEGFDLELTGFDADEIAAALRDSTPIEGDSEAAPEPPDEPVSRLGDLWILGNHRLLCGDSTKAEDVARLMDGEVADCWITDPPYNIAYEGGSRKRDAIDNDSMAGNDFLEFLTTTFGYAIDHLKPGGSAYIWHADGETVAFRLALEANGFQVRQTLIWSKSTATFCRSDYHWRHEACLYGWKDGASHNWFADRKQTTVLEFDRPSVSKDHPTMKPVDLIAYQMENSSRGGQLLLDLFLGSGTTLIAAEQLGRKCYGMEISPAYCDVIVKRWEDFTGKKATLEDGRTFDEVAIERCASAFHR